MSNEPYTVVAILEARKGREGELRQALISVAELSRSEKTNIQFRLHQDVNNCCKFILYENWVSREAHEQQFKKPYIIDLANKLESLLKQKPAHYCANEILIQS